MDMKISSLDYSSSGNNISPSNPISSSAQSYFSSSTPAYASSDRFSCSYNIGNNTSVGGYVSHDSSKAGGSGYGAGITLGFKF